MASNPGWWVLGGWAVGLAAIAVAACAPGRSPAIAQATLAEEIASGTAPLILDVRSTGEYDAGHVPGAIHIPFQSVASRVAELPAELDTPIVVYCAHGPRAAWAGRALRKAGYTDVVYLKGHMTAWKKAGLPVETTAAAAESGAREVGHRDAAAPGND